MKSRLLKIIVLSGACIAFTASVAWAGGVRNGGFERGLNGWTTSERGGGEWESATKAQVKDVDSSMPGPKAGKRQALVTQGGPGSNLLLQKLKLRAHRKHRLSLQINYLNNAGVFASPNTFSADGGGLARGIIPPDANQQLRVEVIKSKAPKRTVKRKHILATLLRTMPGDEPQTGWTRYSANLNKYAGKNVTLRIAEVDNLGEFYVGVDSVKLKSKKRGHRR